MTTNSDCSLSSYISRSLNDIENVGVLINIKNITNNLIKYFLYSIIIPNKMHQPMHQQHLPFANGHTIMVQNP